MQGGLELEYSRSMVFCTWAGFEEMYEVNGSKSAIPQDDGSLEIAFAYHLGDEATLKAVRPPSSTACQRPGPPLSVPRFMSYLSLFTFHPIRSPKRREM